MSRTEAEQAEHDAQQEKLRIAQQRHLASQLHGMVNSFNAAKRQSERQD